MSTLALSYRFAFLRPISAGFVAANITKDENYMQVIGGDDVVVTYAFHAQMET
jgi:hypothetical protein